MEGTCSTVVLSVSVCPVSTATTEWPSRRNPAAGIGSASTGLSGIWPGKIRSNSRSRLAGARRGMEPTGPSVAEAPVGGVDVGEPAAGPLDRVPDALDLRADEGRVHQEGVLCSEDQRRRQ